MEDNRPRYKAICRVCGEVMYVCLSIGQSMGMLDFGSGRCLDCKEKLRFTFNPEELTMTATVWKALYEGKVVEQDK